MNNEESYNKSIEFVLEKECGRNRDGTLRDGYTNDPFDMGGETKYGISKRAHPNEDIKNMTLERAKEIYFYEYWMPYASKVSWPLNICYFDTAVHGGLASVKRRAGPEATYKTFLEHRIARFKDIVKANPSQKRFINGWTNRVNDLKKYIELINAENLA